MATYKILVGIDYGDKRAEAGDNISDLPTKSISWLLEQGIIESVDDSSTTSATTNNSRSKKTEEVVLETIEEEEA